MRPAYTTRRLLDATRALRLRRALEARERWPRERLEAHQQRALERLLAHARDNSPFYRRRLDGISPRGVQLEDLPTLDKRTLMERWDDIVTDRRLKLAAAERHVERARRDDHHLGGYRICATSGSTGRKGIFVWDRREWSTVLAAVLRWNAFMGAVPRIRNRIRYAAIGATSPVHQTSLMATTLDVGLMKLLRLDATAPIPQLVDALNRFRPEVINAYPSIASLLALEQRAGRLQIAPRAVCTTSEVRTEEMTERIKDAWHTEPFDCYGLTEVGIFGSDDGYHRGIHPFEDLLIIEVVDAHERPVEPGTAGAKLLVTNLYNRTQPLIRYEVSDLVTVAAERCPCGRPFRLLTGIDGRSDDILELQGRTGQPVTVHPLRLRSPMARLPEVRQYQFVREAADRVDLFVALERSVDEAAAAERVRRAVAKDLDAIGVDGAILVVHPVERIAGEAKHAAKFKLVTSKV
jgi:phenylacetate-CoA ligase